MTDSKGAKEKIEQVELLTMQVNQKVKQVENTSKLYFQSLIVLASGIAIAITALIGLNDLEKILTVLTFVAPAFLIVWFGCFIFIYWEHHMIRVSLDYSEKRAAEIMEIPPSETYLYHEDFLGVLNQTTFLPKLYPFNKLKVKSVQIIFIIIGIPVATVFIVSLWKANEYFDSTYLYIIYLIFNIILVIILLGIHLQSLRKERQLKNRLGIIPWYMRQDDNKINRKSNDA